MAAKKATVKPQDIVVVDVVGDKIAYSVPGAAVDYAEVGDITLTNVDASIAYTASVYKTTGVASSDATLLFEQEIAARDSFYWPFKTKLGPSDDIVVKVGTANKINIDLGHVVEVG